MKKISLPDKTKIDAMDSSEDGQLKRRRELNRISKRRCRQRRMERLELLQKEVNQLSADFNALQNENAELRNEFLVSISDQHPNGTQAGPPQETPLDRIVGSALPPSLRSLSSPTNSTIDLLQLATAGSAPIESRTTGSYSTANKNPKPDTVHTFFERNRPFPTEMPFAGFTEPHPAVPLGLTSRAMLRALIALGPLTGQESLSQRDSNNISTSLIPFPGSELAQLLAATAAGTPFLMAPTICSPTPGFLDESRYK